MQERRELHELLLFSVRSYNYSKRFELTTSLVKVGKEVVQLKPRGDRHWVPAYKQHAAEEVFRPKMLGRVETIQQQTTWRPGYFCGARTQVNALSSLRT